MPVKSGAHLDAGRRRYREVNLQLEDVGRWFGTDVLFRGVSCELLGGATCLISGPNGSGKSTLMRILAGVLRSSEGEVRLHVNGAAVASEDRPLRTMLVAPYLGMYRGLTARENLEFALSSSRKKSTDAIIPAAIERVGLGASTDRLVANFSSGMVQRLRLAVAILRQPAVCLLDEPWMNLDDEGRELVLEEMSRMQKAGSVVVVASNDPVLKERSFDQHIPLTEYAP